MIRKILHTAFYMLAIAATIALLGFASSHNRQLPCTQMDIIVNSPSGNPFIVAETIRNIIISKIDTLEGRIPPPNALATMSEIIEGLPHVETARVFRTINGDIRADITQRTPLLRMVNSQNESFYVDPKGIMFPLSDLHTARVMLVTGHVPVEYSEGTHIVSGKKGEGENEIMKGLLEVVTFIHDDPFWQAFIDHITITPEGKFEMTPKNGAHIIEFGYPDRVEGKFEKLYTFYRDGLTQTGWTAYRIINLEYKNQIVCSKY